MKDLLTFIALGLNALVLVLMTVYAIVEGVNRGLAPAVPSVLLLATAPVSALIALGAWRRPTTA